MPEPDPPPTPIDRSPRELVRRYLDAINERALDELDVIFPPSFVSHLRVGDIVGLDAFKAMLRECYSAFPDVVWTAVEEIHAPGRAVLRYYFEGTHLGPFLGVPASHRRVRIDACEVMAIEGGWIPEIWNYADLMGLGAQINAVHPLALQV
jgi:steroid delta-isomerase-like uncharacterized protein